MGVREPTPGEKYSAGGQAHSVFSLVSADLDEGIVPFLNVDAEEVVGRKVFAAL